MADSFETLTPVGALFGLGATILGEPQGQIAAILADGHIAVVTVRNPQTQLAGGVFANIYDKTGTALGGPIQLYSFAAALSPPETVITPLKNGGFVVTWSDILNPAPSPIVPSAHFALVGSAGNILAGGDRAGARIAAAPAGDGGFALGWTLFSGGFHVETAQYNASGDLQPTGANSFPNGSGELFGATADGGYIAYINHSSPPGEVIRYINGTSVGSEITLSMTVKDAALLTDGHVVLAGIKQGNGIDVFTQVFDPSTGTLGAVTQVNLSTTGDQSIPQVTALDGGRYLVSWHGGPASGETTAREFLSDGTGGPEIALAGDVVGRFPDNSLLVVDSDDANGVITAQRYKVTDPGSGSQGQTFTANDSAGQILVGGPGDDVFNAGHNSVILTGNGGADKYVFQYLPWNAGHITDFAVGADKLDLSALLNASGYAGSNPVVDGYLRIASNGSSGTLITYDPDGLASGNPWPFWITTLDNVSPAGLTAASLLAPGGGSPPPPPPPPPPGGGSGSTLTANDTPGQILIGGPGDDVFNAGHNSVILTGDGGADKYVFQFLPWNAGHITDFAVGTDRLDLSALFNASGYAGSNPVADGFLRIVSNGSGGTLITYDSDGPAPGNPWPFWITTLDNVSPAGLTAASLLAPGGGTPPPPPPPPPPGGGSGGTFTANDTPGQMLTGGAGNDKFFAGHNSVILTGDGGADQFVFQYLPWNAGRISDFQPGVDTLDFRPLFQATGYGGTNPIADGYLRFDADGADGTKVTIDTDGPAPGNPWQYAITDLAHVAPGAILSSDWLFA